MKESLGRFVERCGSNAIVCPGPRDLIVLVLALTALAGCTRYYWSKPGSTPAEFSKDSQECVREATPRQSPTVVGVETNDKVSPACFHTRSDTPETTLRPTTG